MDGTDGAAEEFAGLPDVREHLAQLLVRDDPSPDSVDWGAFHHAYGHADDVPELLRGLRDRDAQVAAKCLSRLWNRVRHQGGSSAPAALVVPFLVRAADDPATHGRADLVMLAAEAGHRNHFGPDARADLLQVEDRPGELWLDTHGYPVHWTLEAARAALTAHVPVLIGLLGDADQAVRANAAYALATAAYPPPDVARALRDRLGTETEPPVRISLVLAITQLTVEHGHDPAILAWLEHLWSRDRNPADLRLAGGLAWLCATATQPPARLLDLLIAVAGKPAEDWLRAVPWLDEYEYRHGLAVWLVSFLDKAAPAQASVAGSLVSHPDAAVTASALAAALDIACTWRTHADEMVDLIAEQLQHSRHTIRAVAAELLTACGAVTPATADRVATALDSGDPQLRACAAVTLAHCGDARGAAPLAELLVRNECPWPASRRWPNGPQRLLNLLQPHADLVMPAVTFRLADVTNQSWRRVRLDLLGGVATWRPPPATVVATLTELITHDSGERTRLAMILGRIGPPAAAAIPALDRLIPDAGNNDLGALVWARWRITGEHAARTADTLARLTSIPPHASAALRLLADLGPDAAAHEPLIRAMLADGYEWVQAEAARALWRCTGDLTDSLPALLRVLSGYPYLPLFAPVHTVAVTCLGQIGPPAREAVPVLSDYLAAPRRSGHGGGHHDPISWDQHGQHVATTALSRIRSSTALPA